MERVSTGEKKTIEKVKKMEIPKGDGYAYFLIMGTPPTEQNFRLGNYKQYESVKNQIKSGKTSIFLEKTIDSKGKIKDDPVRIDVTKFAYISTDKVYHGKLVLPNNSPLVGTDGKPIN